jgi:peptidoglycan/xylan/chitin deacetylase (PgdA/CDA1 family)
MKIRKAKGKALSFLKNKLVKKSLVLIYHRVIDLKEDPQQLTISLHNFEKQLSYLKEHYTIKSLQELINDLRVGNIIDESIAITFDDGYFDNYLFALPILEKLQIPATFFVSTGYINKEDEFWWDKLETILLISAELPANLKITFKGKTVNWEDCNKNRHVIYKDILSMLKKSNLSEIQNVIDQLISWSGNNYKPRQNYRPMNLEELIAMSKSQMAEIGAHTINHCVLANESIEDQKKEINESKLFLENVLNKKINSFSYPFGSINDYSDFTPTIVEELGFNCGIANNQNLVTKKTNVYTVPRFLVRNWDVAEFKNKIKNIFRFGPE